MTADDLRAAIARDCPDRLDVGAQPALRNRAIDAVGQALNAGRYWLPVEGRPIAVDAVLALTDAELDTARRRAVALVERADAAREWGRQHLTPEQQSGLLAALRGGQPIDRPAA